MLQVVTFPNYVGSGLQLIAPLKRPARFWKDQKRASGAIAAGARGGAVPLRAVAGLLTDRSVRGKQTLTVLAGGDAGTRS